MDNQKKYDELIENHENLMNRLNQFESNWYIFKNSKNTIWQAYQIKGWYEFFVNKDIRAAKQSFYDASKVDIYYYHKFQENVQDLFSAGRTHVLETALSDSASLMVEYDQIDYPIAISRTKFVKYQDKVNSGEMHIYCDLINKAMNQKLDELANLINIVETKSLEKKKNQWIKIDLDFFRGIINNDKDSVYNAVNELCTKEHKKRNKHSWIYKDILSHPAQGYAKIAWLNGIQIEVDNDLVHTEFLPIDPNKEYLDNAKKLINKMTLESNIEYYNGQKLSEDEYNQLYN